MSYIEINRQKLKELCEKTLAYWPDYREKERETYYKSIINKLNKPTFWEKLFKLKKKKIYTLEEGKEIYWKRWEHHDTYGDAFSFHVEEYIGFTGGKAMGIARDLLSMAENSASDTIKLSLEDYRYIR